VGAAAPDEFRERVERLAAEHHPELTVDCSRAYHFGPRYMVELEVRGGGGGGL
jgi:hypothetical protein